MRRIGNHPLSFGCPSVDHHQQNHDTLSLSLHATAQGPCDVRTGLTSTTRAFSAGCRPHDHHHHNRADVDGRGAEAAAVLAVVVVVVVVLVAAVVIFVVTQQLLCWS